MLIILIVQAFFDFNCPAVYGIELSGVRQSFNICVSGLESKKQGILIKHSQN